MSALTGLSIVDFSRFLPGAYAGWVAADMGADVIRVEHPRELAKQAAMFGENDDQAAALRRRARPSYTRNKRSLKIDPGHEQSRPILEKLIAKADVLIEDYRPGVLASMGYGVEAMLALNPRLIYLSVSFAGQTGPCAQRAGHDPAALALAGALSRLNGLPTPSLPGLQVADVLTGAHATIALLLALQARERTGKGQHVDVAMSDACLPLLAVSMGRHDDMDAMPQPGAWHPKGGCGSAPMGSIYAPPIWSRVTGNASAPPSGVMIWAPCNTAPISTRRCRPRLPPSSPRARAMHGWMAGAGRYAGHARPHPGSGDRPSASPRARADRGGAAARSGAGHPARLALYPQGHAQCPAPPRSPARRGHSGDPARTGLHPCHTGRRRMMPLDGIRVLDFTHAIAGPTATQMLAQLGAQIIKVEPPGKGDDFRHYTEHAGLPGMSIPFAAVNAGNARSRWISKRPRGWPLPAIWPKKLMFWSRTSGPA
jgi:crotonobetainyl-CoA:carnitine CoA-transferase CaiB-like acyl-CoA transferase